MGSGKEVNSFEREKGWYWQDPMAWLGKGKEHSAVVRKQCAQGTTCLLSGVSGPSHVKDGSTSGSEE